jgi:hypothetical protein
MSSTAVEIPGYVAGTYTIDPATPMWPSPSAT